MAWPTLPSDWSSGDVLTAADLNTHNDALQTIETAVVTPPTWTATGTAVSLGNATVSGLWRQVGDWMDVMFDIVMGSTTTYGTGTYYWPIPNSGVASFAQTIGAARIHDSGTTSNSIQPVARVTSSGTTIILAKDNGITIGATDPFTFATGDSIQFSGRIWIA